MFKPYFALFVTNAVASVRWSDEFDRTKIDVLGYLISLAEKIPQQKKKLPLKNKYALYLYARAAKYLDFEFERDTHSKYVGVPISQYIEAYHSWYFAKYIKQIIERRKKDEKKHEDVEG